MSDKLRNEVEIELAGQVRTMRATFKTMRAIETALGKPWASLGQMVLDGTFGFTEITTIIYHGLRGRDDTRLSFEQVGDAVLENGINAMHGAVVEFINVGFSGTGKTVGKSEGTQEAAQ